MGGVCCPTRLIGGIGGFSLINIHSLGGELHVCRPCVPGQIPRTRVGTERVAKGGVEAEELTKSELVAFSFSHLGRLIGKVLIFHNGCS